MTPSMHRLAPTSLPLFIVSPGNTDYLLIGMAIFLVTSGLGVGILNLRLYTLPGHIARKAQKVQYEVVCVLALLALFTHIYAYWIAGLLLALIDFPDFVTPLRRTSEALDRIAVDHRHRAAVRGVNGQPRIAPEALAVPFPGHLSRADGQVMPPSVQAKE